MVAVAAVAAVAVVAAMVVVVPLAVAPVAPVASVAPVAPVKNSLANLLGISRNYSKIPWGSRKVLMILWWILQRF